MTIFDNHRRRRLSILNESETARLNITDGVVFELQQPLVSGSLMEETLSLQLFDD